MVFFFFQIFLFLSNLTPIVIYSPSVFIFRDVEETGYKFLENPIEMSFAACAAYRSPEINFGGSVKQNYTQKKGEQKNLGKNTAGAIV